MATFPRTPAADVVLAQEMVTGLTANAAIYADPPEAPANLTTKLTAYTAARNAAVAAQAAAATRPVGVVSTAQRLRHEIRFFDESTPTRKARPAGVMGCEIWVKVGTTPPADNSECTFLALDTASPYVAEYTGEDAGKTAYYMLRWVTTRGEKGPWSETVAATVAG